MISRKSTINFCSQVCIMYAMQSFLTWDFQQFFRKSMLKYFLKFLLFDASFWFRFCSKLDIGLPQFLWQHKIRLKALKLKKKMWILHAKVRKVPKGHWADFGPFSFSLNHDDVKWVPLKGSWQGFYSRHAWRKSNMTWNNAKKKCTRKKIKKLLVTFFSRNKR